MADDPELDEEAQGGEAQPEPEDEETETEEIQMVAIVGSSNVLAAGYGPVNGILLVEYQQGKIYRWTGIPASTYHGLLTAISPGGFMYREVQSRYGKGTLI